MYLGSFRALSACTNEGLRRHQRDNRHCIGFVGSGELYLVRSLRLQCSISPSSTRADSDNGELSGGGGGGERERERGDKKSGLQKIDR